MIAEIRPDDDPLVHHKAKLIHKLLMTENPKAVTWGGFHAALIGIARRPGMPCLAIYDYDACVEILIARGVTEDKAVEHIEFNLLNCYAGEHSPMMLFSPL